MGRTFKDLVITVLLPRPELFLYMYVRKEAVFSSQIEGTQSTLSDLLRFETEAEAGKPINDIREVSNYVDAMMYGLERLAELPLSLRLIREMHARLLRSGRGGTKNPGEFRRTQKLDWRDRTWKRTIRAPACHGTGRMPGPV
jgi:Fic family protein